MVEGIKINRKENVLVNIKTLKEVCITIEKLNDADILLEFEKLLVNHNTELDILPLNWFRTEIIKRMNKNE